MSSEQQISVPETPKRRQKRNGAEVYSPYFSPVFKRQAVRQQIESCTSTRLCLPSKPSVHNEAEDPFSANKDAAPQFEQDPLTLFYTRTVDRLHAEVAALKPILIQETLAHDPWKLLIAVTLLNKTSGKLAIPVFWKLIAQWPTPFALSQANEDALIELLTPLGTQRRRARRLIRMSELYMQDPPSPNDLRKSRATTSACPSIGGESAQKLNIKYPPTPVSHLPGSGPYALDSYRIFCTSHEDPTSTEWRDVVPTDKELIRYLKWKWATEEHRQWSPAAGPGQPTTIAYLEALKAALCPR